MDEKHKLLKSVGKVGALTTLSRILGYGRDAVLAAVLGAGLGMDAFAIAFRIANLFRRLLGEGAMTAAFVPVLTQYREEHTNEETWDFVSKFFYTLALMLAGLVVLQIIFAPWIVRIMSPGFGEIEGKWALTTFLNRMMAPYLFFVGLAALLMAILNSLRSYAVSAANPIFFNLAVIASAFTISQLFSEPAVGISLGVLFGGFLQMAVQIPEARKKGMIFKPAVSFSHPEIRKIASLMGPGVVGIGIYQLNLFVDSIVGSLLVEGSVSALYYSNRVVELVQGIFVISFATVILTEMSKHAAEKNHDAMRETLSFSLRMSAFVTIPASFGLMVLAYPITQILFERGEFTAEDTARSAFALMFYAVGICFVAGARIMVQAFYAVQDTKTPVKAAFVSLIVNVIGNILLIGLLAQGGIALATSIAAAVNFFQLLMIYEKRFGKLDWAPLRESLVKILSQTAAMVLACFLFLNLLRYSKDGLFFTNTVALFVTIFLGLAIYLGAALLLNSQELAAIRRGKRPPMPPPASESH